MKMHKLIAPIVGILFASCNYAPNNSTPLSQTFEQKRNALHVHIFRIISDEWKKQKFRDPKYAQVTRTCTTEFTMNINQIHGKKSGDTLSVVWWDRFRNKYEIFVSNNHFGCNNPKIEDTTLSEKDKVMHFLATASQILPSMEGGSDQTIEILKPFMNTEVWEVYVEEMSVSKRIVGLAVTNGKNSDYGGFNSNSYEFKQRDKQYEVSLFGRKSPGEWEVRSGYNYFEGPLVLNSGNELIGGLNYWDVNQPDKTSYHASLFGSIPFFKILLKVIHENGKVMSTWKTVPITKEEFLQNYKKL